jgi:2-polyprenyl-3-methyl-5-hydroxy-6-metoxy-1,4-benzoquinol methylase
MTSIRRSVESRQTAQLAAMRQKAGATIHRWSLASESPLAQTQHAREELIKARMTAMAIEQFVAAFTGAHQRPHWTEKITLWWHLIRHLEGGTLLSLAKHDKAWRLVKNPAAAAASIQAAGFWSLPTKELCEALKIYMGDDEILEVGAGRGLFVAALRECGVRVHGIDDCSWELARRVIHKSRTFMSEESAEDALRRRQPKVVLSVWPPPSNNFEKAVFATPSVKLYLAIVSTHQFASGNWQDYKAQEQHPKGFTCVMNESINKMLRPLESEQRLLIFRRRQL